MAKRYIIQEEDSSEVILKISEQTLAKIFSFAAASLERCKKDEGHLPPTEELALKMIRSAQYRNMNLL